MPDKKEYTLAIYRLNKAEEMLNDSAILLEQGSYKSSNNRSYYAIFHTMRAVFALVGMDFKKHSGVIQYFQKEYIKTGKFDLKCSDIIMSASKIRTASDYDDFYIASKAEAEEQYNNAKEFLSIASDYVKSQK